MYENLEKLRPDLYGILLGLTPLPSEEVKMLQSQWPACPHDYIIFMQMRGFGPLRHDGTPFTFERKLVSAEKEYYRDREIFSNGAKGDVLLFGWESMGTAYGFDSGAKWQLVEVDEYRMVNHLDMSFCHFVEGLFVCFPQIALRYENGNWYDGTGKCYPG